ncbi:hypothetical protein AVEN_188872-1 [Araneus ventricosus]|uniref:Uncharacterized protein n=1 Tax=Araneus ventricosus TaxID=182803 RepID=A0A4Y2A5H7_ARAVE|nr:hypothetical protein AVEN_188872-1 [Araneus ventricosus]
MENSAADKQSWLPLAYALVEGSIAMQCLLAISSTNESRVSSCSSRHEIIEERDNEDGVVAQSLLAFSSLLESRVITCSSGNMLVEEREGPVFE